jgi:hypothetical protein
MLPSTSQRDAGFHGAAGELAKSGVIVLIAIDIKATARAPVHPALPLCAPDERLASYTFLRKLQAGLRSEVWLALPPGSGALDQLVVIKLFFPHAPGPALDALEEELALAQRLSHPNVALTLRVGRDADRRFIISECLEGTTLRALLRRLSVTRQHLPPCAVARVLAALVSAVAHAEHQAASVVAKVLVSQAIAADDVFVTFGADVKLLAFKSKLGSAGAFAASATVEPEEASVYAAIDALLSEHLSPELGAVLAAVAGGSRERRPNGLVYVGRELERWQRKLGSDGRTALTALMGELFASQRCEQRAQLEERTQLEECGEPLPAAPLRPEAASPVEEEAAPVSGFRPIQR